MLNSGEIDPHKVPLTLEGGVARVMKKMLDQARLVCTCLHMWLHPHPDCPPVFSGRLAFWPFCHRHILRGPRAGRRH